MPTLFRTSLSKLSHLLEPRKSAVIFDVDTITCSHKIYNAMQKDRHMYIDAKTKINQQYWLSAEQRKKEIQDIHAKYIMKHPLFAFRAACKKNSTLDELNREFEKNPNLGSVLSEAKPVVSIVKSMLKTRKNVGILQNIGEMDELATFLLINHGLTEKEARTIPKFLNYDWFESKEAGLDIGKKHFEIPRKKDLLFVGHDSESIADIEQGKANQGFYGLLSGDAYSTLHLMGEDGDFKTINKFIQRSESINENKAMNDEYNEVRQLKI